MNRQYKEEFVEVNGIEHFLLHYPKAPDAPVLLFVHGGPGNVESLFAYELDAAWGDMFTHVHWDQRGAGKTLRRNKGKGMPKTVEQMLNDLHGIVMYLMNQYGGRRIVILGHSWGSLLSSLYIQQHPENVQAYIGVGQMVSMMENERVAYEQVMAAAKNAGNNKHIKILQSLGNYPPSDPELMLKMLMKMREVQAAYDKGTDTGEMLRRMRNSPSFRWGDLISLIRAMKVNRPLLLQILPFNLHDNPSSYKVPVHYILGAADTTTPTSLGKAYYDTIDAPLKTIAIIPDAGHFLMHEKPEEFTTALRSVCESL